MQRNEWSEPDREFEPDEPEPEGELVRLEPEAPEADAIEQRQAIVAEDEYEPIVVPIDAPEADVLEQSRVVPLDDEP